jgi:MoaA/NifB/PqqE/SkfB family radical SAM enzyme
MLRRMLGPLAGMAKAGARLDGTLAEIEAELRAGRGTDAVLDCLEASRRPIFECVRKHLRSPVAAQAVTVKVLNLLLAKYHFRAHSATVRSRPFGLVVDPSNGCNLACPGCVHSRRAKELKLFSWNKGLLPEDRISAFLAAYGPYAIHVNFCNYGEPLTNPETPRFVRRAKNYLMQAMLSTNFSVGRFDAEAYVESGLDYMLVSIDGATQPTYERYRRNGQLEVVFGNIRKLVEARRRLGRRTPVIAWRYLTFEHNIHEIPLALKTARQLEVDQFLTLTPYDVSWDDPEIRIAEVETVNLVLNRETEPSVLANWNAFPESLDAEAIGRAFETPWERTGSEGNRAAVNRGSSCQWLYRSISMDAGGRILPCCAAPRPDLELVFGGFDGGSSDVFNTPRYRLARLSFADMDAYQREVRAAGLVRGPHCANCEWNKETANADSAQIRQFLKAAGKGVFSAASAEVVAGW